MGTDQRHESPLRAWWHSVSGVLRRGFGHAGPERDSLLLILKSAVAATLAWFLADAVLHAPSATFAPFSALLMVQVTVSQSLYQSVRYTIAVVGGVALAGVLSPLLGPGLWVFAVLMLVALLIGQWRKLGDQGSQVAVAALFAYTAFVQSGGGSASWMQLLSLAGLVTLGCATGVITNLVLVPPLRFRSARFAVGTLAHSVCDLLNDLAEGLRDGVPDERKAQEWHDRANRLPTTVTQTQSTVEDAAETLRFNPRRLWMHRGRSFDGYRTIINALDRIIDQLRAITRGLTYAAETGRPHQDAHEQFLRALADVLSVLTGVADILGRLHSTTDVRQDDSLENHITQARETYRHFVQHTTEQHLDDTDQWPAYNALQTDTHRILEEFLDVQRELEQLTEPTTHTPVSEASGHRTT